MTISRGSHLLNKTIIQQLLYHIASLKKRGATVSEKPKGSNTQHIWNLTNSSLTSTHQFFETGKTKNWLLRIEIGKMVVCVTNLNSYSQCATLWGLYLEHPFYYYGTAGDFNWCAACYSA